MKDAHVFACSPVSPFNTYGVCNESGGKTTRNYPRDLHDAVSGVPLWFGCCLTSGNPFFVIPPTGNVGSSINRASYCGGKLTINANEIVITMEERINLAGTLKIKINRELSSDFYLFVSIIDNLFKILFKVYKCKYVLKHVLINHTCCQKRYKSNNCCANKTRNLFAHHLLQIYN